MKQNVFERVDEKIFTKTLKNGIEVYLYNTNKTKNFYISISVKYGAKITKYKSGNRVVDVIAGSAHFLEHKVMALSENEEISKRINDLGSLANAWTNYEGTNYNIFGSMNIKENLKLLLDIFYNTNINEKNVEEEKGIIGEEIDMYKDQINYYMYSEIFNNLFEKSYIKNTVVGERNTIDKITSKYLNQIYDDYYIPNNTFIIVCGNFDTNDIINEIEEYMDKLNLQKKKLPIRIVEKDKTSVCVPYEEIQKETEDIRVKYAIKIPRKNFSFKDDTFLKYYISIILSCNFSTSSKLFEYYKNNDIMINMSHSTHQVDDYIIIIISAICRDANIFIDNISKDIKKLKIDKINFDRKKKLFLKSYIIDFDNIEDVEYNICDSILIDNKINYNEYSDIMNMNYEEANNILHEITFDNISIIRTIK